MKTEGFDKVDILLKTLAYDELSASEKELVENEIGGQKAYEELQTLLHQVQAQQALPPKGSTKTVLMKNFKHKHQPWLLGALQFKTPIYLNLAAMLTIALLLWIWMPVREVQNTVLVEMPPRIDTVRIQLPGDTIYIRETIKVNIPVYVASTTPETKTEKAEEIKGSSLKDQKALRDLLAETSTLK